MTKPLFECKFASYKHLIKLLNYNGTSTEVLEEPNKSRHMIIKVLFDKAEKWYLVYKREWRNTFKKYYPDVYKKYSLKDHRGESLNVECFNYAMEKRVDKVVFCHPEGFFYEDISRFGTFAVENGCIWKQNKTNIYKKEGGGLKKLQETTLLYPKEYLHKLILE